MTFIRAHIKQPVHMVIALLFFCSAAGIAHAQDNSSDDQNQDAQQKIEALKMAYLTQQLDLSPKEAEKFWPLYNQYQKDMHNIVKERKQIEMNKNQLNQADNKQIEQSMNKDFQLQQQALQIRQKYRKEFQNVLPPRKVMKVYRSEKDFNMKLIEELRRRQTNSPEMNRPGNRLQPSTPAFRPASRPQVRPESRPLRQQEPKTSPPVRKFNRPDRAPANHPARPAADRR